jgi:hypothetical protein
MVPVSYNLADPVLKALDGVCDGSVKEEGELQKFELPDHTSVVARGFIGRIL